jgi:K+-transporting ATPase ATPase C chain
MKMAIKALLLSLALMLLCGVIYPLTITGLSQVIFPKQANGSIVEFNGSKVGSSLLGQSFDDPRFFKGRISNVNYNTYSQEDLIPDKDGKATYGGVGSGSANLAPSNPALEKRVAEDIDLFLNNNPGIKKEDLPIDIFTSSASGLDPHISPASARLQIASISKASGIPASSLEGIVNNNIEGRQFGVFGDPRVNVLKLNLEIAKILKDNGKL